MYFYVTLYIYSREELCIFSIYGFGTAFGLETDGVWTAGLNGWKATYGIQG